MKITTSNQTDPVGRCRRLERNLILSEAGDAPGTTNVTRAYPLGERGGLNHAAITNDMPSLPRGHSHASIDQRAHLGRFVSSTVPIQIKRQRLFDLIDGYRRKGRHVCTVSRPTGNPVDILAVQTCILKGSLNSFKRKVQPTAPQAPPHLRLSNSRNDCFALTHHHPPPRIC